MQKYIKNQRKENWASFLQIKENPESNLYHKKAEKQVSVRALLKKRKQYNFDTLCSLGDSKIFQANVIPN